MLTRSALLFVVLASAAQAAPFDDVKDNLASCLRFEMNGSGARGEPTRAEQVRFALERCGPEYDRLERADPRRIRSDGGISPSTKAVIASVVGRGGAAKRASGGFANVRY